MPILVFNPLGWQRSGLAHIAVENAFGQRRISILDASNHVLPSQILSSDSATNTYHVLVDVKDVPSIGYEVLHAVHSARTSSKPRPISRFTE